MPMRSAEADEVSAVDLRHLRTAARLAERGHGRAEPNPLVGCVITSDAGDVVGYGYHRRFGGPHAEINALRMAGDRARGGTCYVTLEPCHHTGKTGPCSEAIIDAGIRRVIIGRADPHPDACGGAARLRDAGIETIMTDQSPEAIAITDPFIHRVRTGLPWVIVKWAQTLDGAIATRAGMSQWISGPASRLLVHRKRAKVDAILTGIGTVIADDPMLTARSVRIRRTARRVILDPDLDMPLDSAIVRTAGSVPTTIVTSNSARHDARDHAEALHTAGIELLSYDRNEAGELPLMPMLRDLVTRHDATNVLVEAGPGLISRFFQQQLVHEVWAFLSSQLLGDEAALPAVRGRDAPRLADAIKLELLDHRRRGHDIVARYRVKAALPVHDPPRAES